MAEVKIGSGGKTPSSRVSRDSIATVTARDFSQVVLGAKGPVVVEFMSYGCVHCRAIEPALQQVAEMMNHEIDICRVNVPVEQGLAEEYGISGTPTFIMFLHGSVVDRVEGPPPTLASVLQMVTKPFGIDGRALSKNAG